MPPVRRRIKLHLSHPFDSDPRTEKHCGLRTGKNLHFRRARFGAQGHLIGPWLDHNFEHDVADNNVLNLYVTVKKYEWPQFRAGRWKAEFSRERVTSSGKQRFADRSTVNREFAVDRQPGFALGGHLLPGTRGDSWYSAGVFTRTGLGNRFDGGGRPMYLARYR